MMRIVMLCLLLAPVARAAEPPADVLFTRGIVYGKGGGEDLKLNLARPKNSDSKKLPCIVFIHGGGWTAGNRKDADVATWDAAQHGYVAVTVDYRLTPKYRFPTQVNDVKCAVRFLRAHAAEYGVDPDRIGACGWSAGAHLALMLGVTSKDDGLEGDGGWAEQSSRVQAVVSFFGPTDLTAPDMPERDTPLLVAFLGGKLDEKGDEYKRASPITYVTKDDPPMLLIQGTGDPLVPYTQAYKMLDAMTEAGVPGRADFIAGANHGWFSDPHEMRRTAGETIAFFDRYLKPTAATTRPSRAAR